MVYTGETRVFIKLTKTDDEKSAVFIDASLIASVQLGFGHGGRETVVIYGTPFAIADAFVRETPEEVHAKIMEAYGK